MMQHTATPSKSQVHIEIVDPRAGIYAALSSDQTRYYTVNVAARSCSCPSGAHGFRGVKAHGGMCRHLLAARVIARSLASMTATDRARALATVRNIRVNVEAVDVSRLSAPLARRPVAVAA